MADVNFLARYKYENRREHGIKLVHWNKGSSFLENKTDEIEAIILIAKLRPYLMNDKTIAIWLEVRLPRRRKILTSFKWMKDGLPANDSTHKLRDLINLLFERIIAHGFFQLVTVANGCLINLPLIYKNKITFNF